MSSLSLNGESHDRRGRAEFDPIKAAWASLHYIDIIVEYYMLLQRAMRSCPDVCDEANVMWRSLCPSAMAVKEVTNISTGMDATCGDQADPFVLPSAYAWGNSGASPLRSADAPKHSSSCAAVFATPSQDMHSVCMRIEVTLRARTSRRQNCFIQVQHFTGNNGFRHQKSSVTSCWSDG